MITLIVLAYNEENNLYKTVTEVANEFDEVIIVNDNSRDKTFEITEKLKKNLKNIKIINNEKNYGAGKSFQIAINEFIKSKNDYFIKIDGDGQFKKNDILNTKKLIKQNKNVDFIKFDRFWKNGIEGKIPTIRYFGNAFASFLLKIATGNWYLNDPLNGLQALSRKAASLISIPKLFSRYGYPFFITTTLSNESLNYDLKIVQTNNTVIYENNKKSIKPLVMFFRLIFFTIKSFYKKIIMKLKYSDLQLSAILDMFSILFLIGSGLSLTRFIRIRYFDLNGPQSTWFLLFLILILMFIFIIYQSQKIESEENLRNFDQIKKDE